MPDTLEATVRDVGTIHVTCESCGHEYEYEQIFLGKAEVRPADARRESVIALQAMAEQLRSGFGKGDYRRLEWHRCPECGYTQSWMVRRSRRSLALRIFAPIVFGSLIIGLLTSMFQRDVMVGGQILRIAFIIAGAALAAGILFWLFYRPARRDVTQTIGPVLTFSSENPEALDEMIVGNMQDGESNSPL